MDRHTLVRITNEVLLESNLSSYKKRKLKNVAKNADKILLNGWINDKCGCLVGTAYYKQLSMNDPNCISYLDAPLLIIGVKFNAIMCEELKIYDHMETIEVDIVD